MFKNLIIKNSLKIINFKLKIVRLPFDFAVFLLVRYFPGYRRLPILAQRGIAILLIVVIFSSTLASYLYLLPSKAEAAWFDDSWGYRQRVNITKSGSAQTDYN